MLPSSTVPSPNSPNWFSPHFQTVPSDVSAIELLSPPQTQNVPSPLMRLSQYLHQGRRDGLGLGRQSLWWMRRFDGEQRAAAEGDARVGIEQHDSIRGV